MSYIINPTNMAISEELCDPIYPCTWYRGDFLCPQDTGEENMDGKYVSFLQQLLDEMTIELKEGRIDRATIMQTIRAFMETLGMTREDISSLLEQPRGEPKEEMNVVMVTTVVEKLLLTILMLAILYLLTSKMGMPDDFAFGQKWIYGLYISSTWCDLFYRECPIYFTPMVFFSWYLPIVLICMFLQYGSHEILMILNVFLHGRHFVLDYILQGLVLANLKLEEFQRMLFEGSYGTFELLFDTLETMFDKGAKLCELIIERIVQSHIHMPTIKNLSQGQRHFCRCILLMVCVALRDVGFAGLCLGSIAHMFCINFNATVGNTHLWQKWLNHWESIKERICEEYFKMPAGLQPNRYHTRYFIGLDRIRVFEYGVIIQVLASTEI